jgi:DNA-directed RNA polymerase specialized sigma24 family protein
LLDEFVKSRSQIALRELVTRHPSVIYSTARRMVRDSHLTEEVSQSVSSMLAQKDESIRVPQVLGGWLYNTTCHLAVHAVRTELQVSNALLAIIGGQLPQASLSYMSWDPYHIFKTATELFKECY